MKDRKLKSSDQIKGDRMDTARIKEQLKLLTQN